MSELPKTYDAKEVESRWGSEWIRRGLFRAGAARGGTPYAIVIPPPNITGILHMGHALNAAFQDILTRWKRMQGFNAVWVPGIDHAGIATQNVVERALRREGLTRDELGREAFVQRVWAWKAEYGGTIIRQLQRLGAACDWDRTRFTLDEGLSRAVREVFVRLYDKGLVTRGQYIINWCPRCGTALSDEECEHHPVRGKLYRIRYPAKDRPGVFLAVATTRPETLLGDTAVAVNPRDERYADWLGKPLLLPILGREIPVVADDFVDPEFGTGAVKVTPAHDPNDFEIGRRHGLEAIRVMDERGAMNDRAGPYAGLDRAACRERLVADLEREGLLEGAAPHEHAVGRCYRCQTDVEPSLSPQWFVRMKPLAAPALQAVREGRVRFVPGRWTGVYEAWMENLRDWCISRQIWWGHRIPVFTCETCGREWADRSDPDRCPACGAAGIRQDEDVLDTWFSSWLWPFSVFGWPDSTPDLRFYYPGDTLTTASEILFFWVARMVMAGLEFMGEVPFRTVFIHGTVRDAQGRKMSKSLGNSIDPLEVIERYSADALRSGLMISAATGQDVFLSDESFEAGRNFGTKIWNAARFLRMQPDPPADAPGVPDLDPALLSSDDRHLLATLGDTIRAATAALESLRFNDYALALHAFLWHSFCDWHLESAKEALNGPDPARRAQTLRILHHAFSTGLRLLHPLMPFLTEELWHLLDYAKDGRCLLETPWPAPADPESLRRWGADSRVVRFVEDRRELIRAARALRAGAGLAPKQPADFVVRAKDPDAASALELEAPVLARAIGARALRIDADCDPPAGMAAAVSPLGPVFLAAADPEAERAKRAAQLGRARADLARVRAKLDNADFVSKAPAGVVGRQRERRAELETRIGELERLTGEAANRP